MAQITQFGFNGRRCRSDEAGSQEQMAGLFESVLWAVMSQVLGFLPVLIVPRELQAFGKPLPTLQDCSAKIGKKPELRRR